MSDTPTPDDPREHRLYAAGCAFFPLGIGISLGVALHVFGAPASAFVVLAFLVLPAAAIGWRVGYAWSANTGEELAAAEAWHAEVMGLPPAAARSRALALLDSPPNGVIVERASVPLVRDELDLGRHTRAFFDAFTSLTWGRHRLGRDLLGPSRFAPEQIRIGESRNPDGEWVVLPGDDEVAHLDHAEFAGLTPTLPSVYHLIVYHLTEPDRGDPDAA